MKQNYFIQLSPEELGVIIKKEIEDSLRSFINELGFNSGEELLNREEVAKLLGKSVATVDNYKRNGLLPYNKIGKAVYFNKKDIFSSLVTIRN